jgi:hypothetical protein
LATLDPAIQRQKVVTKLIASALLLITSELFGISQTASQTTNKFRDGSVIKIEAVSFGVIHRIPSRYGQGQFFKSASPTIMFTTSRKAPAGQYLEELWTKAEALGAPGSWYPLRRRIEPRPAKEGLEDAVLFYDGPPPRYMWETWEFPDCPEPSPWLQVRVWLTPNSTNGSNVEFRLPNDKAWRERSAKENASDFHEQEWLNSELWRAALRDSLPYAKDLIAQGADPNSSYSEGMSALAIACQDDHEDVVRFLLAYGADVNAHGKDKADDRSALMAAASNGGHLALVRLLVEKGANVNERDGLGWTALIWAAREGDVESVKYLLSKDADPNVKANDGKSAIELTEETDSTNRFEIVKILKAVQAAH